MFGHGVTEEQLQTWARNMRESIAQQREVLTGIIERAGDRQGIIDDAQDALATLDAIANDDTLNLIDDATKRADSGMGLNQIHQNLLALIRRTFQNQQEIQQINTDLEQVSSEPKPKR